MRGLRARRGRPCVGGMPKALLALACAVSTVMRLLSPRPSPRADDCRTSSRPRASAVLARARARACRAASSSSASSLAAASRNLVRYRFRRPLRDVQRTNRQRDALPCMHRHSTCQADTCVTARTSRVPSPPACTSSWIAAAAPRLRYVVIEATACSSVKQPTDRCLSQHDPRIRWGPAPGDSATSCQSCQRGCRSRSNVQRQPCAVATPVSTQRMC